MNSQTGIHDRIERILFPFGLTPQDARGQLRNPPSSTQS
jgi:hypothetical protein